MNKMTKNNKTFTKIKRKKKKKTFKKIKSIIACDTKRILGSTRFCYFVHYSDLFLLISIIF